MPIAVPVSNEAEYEYTFVLAEIRAQMGRLQMSGQELGVRAGLKQSTISRRMTGGTAFTLPELFDVCRVLGMDLTELITEAQKHHHNARGVPAKGTTTIMIPGIQRGGSATQRVTDEYQSNLNVLHLPQRQRETTEYAVPAPVTYLADRHRELLAATATSAPLRTASVR